MRYLTKTLLGVLLATTMLAGAAGAKTLVYCSEGSPENFNPQINTTGTSLDAARHVYNQLVEFEPGTTNVVAGLAEKWEVSADGKTVTFHLRKGVKFHSNKAFKPTRDFDADDSARIAVLWGDAGTFCAGADLKAISTGGLNRAFGTSRVSSGSSNIWFAARIRCT